MISRFDTLQQIKDFIVAVQKDLMLFERKRALLRKAHLALCSYCWYDGMEIDHDSVPTMSYSLEKIHNDVQANIIALDFTGRAVKTMESFLEIIPDIYERMFADKESELRNTDQSVLKYFQKIRNFFPVNGSECIFWKGFAAEKIEVLQQFLAKADDAITQQDASELRRILTDIFQRQVPLFKKQIQGHLEPLKREHEQLKKTLQSIGAAEIIEKCGKPYWVEVCDTTSMFVRNNAFPLPSVCASFFAEGPVLEYAPNGFEYKRIYLDPNQPSRMRIYGFDSKEEFERILNKGDISIEKDDEIQWAKWVITEIDDIFYYNGETELLPQWKEILEEAVSILKERKDDLLYAARGKALLPYPVLELKPAPRGVL